MSRLSRTFKTLSINTADSWVQSHVQHGPMSPLSAAAELISPLVLTSPKSAMSAGMSKRGSWRGIQMSTDSSARRSTLTRSTSLHSSLNAQHMHTGSMVQAMLQPQSASAVKAISQLQARRLTMQSKNNAVDLTSSTALQERLSTFDGLMMKNREMHEQDMSAVVDAYHKAWL